MRADHSSTPWFKNISALFYHYKNIMVFIVLYSGQLCGKRWAKCTSLRPYHLVWIYFCFLSYIGDWISTMMNQLDIPLNELSKLENSMRFLCSSPHFFHFLLFRPNFPIPAQRFFSCLFSSILALLNKFLFFVHCLHYSSTEYEDAGVHCNIWGNIATLLTFKQISVTDVLLVSFKSWMYYW